MIASCLLRDSISASFCVIFSTPSYYPPCRRGHPRETTSVGSDQVSSAAEIVGAAWAMAAAAAASSSPLTSPLSSPPSLSSHPGPDTAPPHAPSSLQNIHRTAPLPVTPCLAWPPGARSLHPLPWPSLPSPCHYSPRSRLQPSSSSSSFLFSFFFFLFSFFVFFCFSFVHFCLGKIKEKIKKKKIHKRQWKNIKLREK